MRRFSAILEGPTGDFDSARLLFVLGGFCGVMSPLIYQAVALYKGQLWDPASFCGGYFGGLGAYLGGGGLGISLKDKGVASAINTTPPAPPAGGQP